MLRLIQSDMNKPKKTKVEVIKYDKVKVLLRESHAKRIPPGRASAW